MQIEIIERKFNKILQNIYYYGDIEFVRFCMFELDKVKQLLERIDYEIRYCKSVDNFCVSSKIIRKKRVSRVV